MKRPVRNTTKKIVKGVSIDSTAGVAGAAVGFVIAGPVGSAIGAALSPVVKEVLSRTLTQKEKDRIDFVVEDAKKKIQQLVANGSKLREDMDPDQLKELFEGTLIKASQTYQEKKLPLISSLLATAPFTNTPLENLNQTLIFAERLSYQQICILAIIGRNTSLNTAAGVLGLSDNDWISEQKTKSDERSRGIYEDIYYLETNRFLYQINDSNTAIFLTGPGNVIPNKLFLHYEGRLLFNGLKLNDIASGDIEEIVKTLR